MHDKGYLLAVVITLFSVYYAANSIVLSITNRKFAKSHGCEAVKRLPQNERILGLQLLRQQLQAARNHTWLETWQKLYRDNGHTFSAYVLGRTSICTIEPENVKTILATNFKDYEVAAGRDEAFSPFLGRDGIFTADGKAWETARVNCLIDDSGKNAYDLAGFTSTKLQERSDF